MHTSATGSDANDNPHYFKSSTFSVTKVGDSDTISIFLDINFINGAWGTPPGDIAYPKKLNPTLQILLTNPTGGTTEDNEQRLIDNWHTYSNQVTFKVTSTGNYTLTVYVTPNAESTYTTFDLYFDNIRALVSSGATTTYDHFYQGVIPANNSAVNIGQFELFFGDGSQNNEVGSLFITGLTKNWATNHTVSENLSLQQLFNKQKLIESASFKQYLRLSYRDSNSIKFNSALQIGSRKFNVTDYQRDILNNRVDLEMVEILTSIPTINYSDSQLSTIDGNA
jgi:hypothetical protein